MEAEVADVRDVSSCDVISCSPPPPSLPLCSDQREDEESHFDTVKLEQQVSGTKHSFSRPFVTHVHHINNIKIMQHHPPSYARSIPNCVLTLQKQCNQMQPKKTVKVS